MVVQAVKVLIALVVVVVIALWVNGVVAEDPGYAPVVTYEPSDIYNYGFGGTTFEPVEQDLVDKKAVSLDDSGS